MTKVRRMGPKAQRLYDELKNHVHILSADGRTGLVQIGLGQWERIQEFIALEGSQPKPEELLVMTEHPDIETTSVVAVFTTERKAKLYDKRNMRGKGSWGPVPVDPKPRPPKRKKPWKQRGEIRGGARYAGGTEATAKESK